MPPDLDTLITIADSALNQAAAAIRPYFRSGLTADDKSDESPVTLADRLAEQTLREALTQATPDFGILGEEFPPTNESAEYIWVIDPIDGTRAFITGRPSFAILLGLLKNGVPILGAIDQPITQERWLGATAHPLRFTGPFGGTPGARQHISLAEAELSSTAPEMIEAAGPDAIARFARLKTTARRIYWGGDAYAHGLLALGQIDLIAEHDLKPWDWAALVPVIESAGGRITDWSGAPLRLGCDGSVLAAANAALHAEALATLRG